MLCLLYQINFSTFKLTLIIFNLCNVWLVKNAPIWCEAKLGNCGFAHSLTLLAFKNHLYGKEMILNVSEETAVCLLLLELINTFWLYQHCVRNVSFLSCSLFFSHYLNHPLNRTSNAYFLQSPKAGSDGLWSKFTWIECERDFTFHHLREPWNPWMTTFPIFRNFDWKNIFLVKSLKLWELGVNMNSYFRNEVKQDSMEC